MTETVKIISPVDGSVYAERPVATDADDRGRAVAARERAASANGRPLPVAERGALHARLPRRDAGDERRDRAANSPGRWAGRSATAARRAASRSARATWSAIAEEALSPIDPPEKDGFRRYITREPLGLVLVIAPWNYPYLTAVNIDRARR